MGTVYLGTSEFAATVLAILSDSPHRPELVVSRPDRPRGRGRKFHPPPVAERARELEIELIQPAEVNAPGAVERIASVAPEALVICAFGAILREPLLSSHPIYNVHPSLLPRWRGAAPIERAIEAGDASTGVCVMRPLAELDAGPIALSVEEPIGAGDDFGTLSGRLAALGGELLCAALASPPAFEEQSQDGVSYAEKIGPDDRLLDSDRPAVELERRVRALHPHVGAQLEIEPGERLGVERARIAEDEAVESGRLTGIGGRLLLGCTPGVLDLIRVRPQGGRSMGGDDYLRGAGRGLIE